VDVSEDTNYVVGGKYGYGKSLLEDSLHTMWEFGLRTQGGIFVMWLYQDEIGRTKIGGTDVKIICNDDGYGLVQAPKYVTGYFGNGSTTYLDDRYIPIQGVAGLVLEPFSFSGELKDNSSTIRVTGESSVSNTCTGNHIIDGLFSPNEWDNSKPAQGKYSNLYADYCDGILYILNDWKLGTEEPDEMNCYNLFELYTGDATEHWGIYVYHDTAKGIRVFRNGVDVSNDTNIVIGGKFNFDKSPNLDTPHTIYEFGIKVSEGNWHLFMCDPGPASFCDTDPRPVPRTITPKTGIRVQGTGSPGDHTGIIPIQGLKNIKLAVGTANDTKDWFSRKFHATIKFDPNTVLSMLISTLESNAIAKDLIIEVDSTTPGLYIVTGTSNSNFYHSGDFFIIDAMLNGDGSGTHSELEINVLLANRTTYMREFNIPKLIFDLISGIEDNDWQIVSSINVYPNPNINAQTSILEFYLQKSRELTVAMFDVVSNKYIIAEKNTYHAGINKINIDVANIPTGVYFIRLLGRDFSRIIKFTKLKLTNNQPRA
jgi:hypothetical protein